MGPLGASARVWAVCVPLANSTKVVKSAGAHKVSRMHSSKKEKNPSI